MFFGQILKKGPVAHDSSESLETENDKKNKSVFQRSLDELTLDDLGPSVPVNKSAPVFGTVRIFLIIVCLAIFAYCSYLFITNLAQYSKADNIYDEMSDDFFDKSKEPEKICVSDGVSQMTLTTPSVAIPIFSEMLKLSDTELNIYFSGGDSTYNIEFVRMKSKLEDLKTKNSDIVGFIKVDGTKISYPVTRHTDNNYYLDHSFDKNPLKSGTIFMDYRNSPTLTENKNIILYGHNMGNGSMFGNVSKFYYSEDLFDKTQIVLYAFDGIYTFEIFAIYRTTADYHYFQTLFDTESDFVDFAYEMKSNSIYSKDVEFTKDDIILTLSTCTNLAQTGRYALHAKLIRIDN